jgi:hypothetical protein
VHLSRRAGICDSQVSSCGLCNRCSYNAVFQSAREASIPGNYGIWDVQLDIVEYMVVVNRNNTFALKFFPPNPKISGLL